jgi:hypothetical protein
MQDLTSALGLVCLVHAIAIIGGAFAIASAIEKISITFIVSPQAAAPPTEPRGR